MNDGRNNNAIRRSPAQRENRHTVLWILGWILVFPIPLMILLLRKTDMRPALRYGAAAAVGAFYLTAALTGLSRGGIPQAGAAVQRGVPFGTSDISALSFERKDDIFLTVGERYSEGCVIAETNSGTAVSPDDLLFVSDDPSIAVIAAVNDPLSAYPRFEITAVSPGETAVRVSSRDGGVSSEELFVAVCGPVREMDLTAGYLLADNQHVGNEWTSVMTVNGALPEDSYTLSVGDELSFYAEFAEKDVYTDVGRAEAAHTVTAEDLIRGFTVTLDVYVTESNGRYAGNTAHFKVDFDFAPRR